jgi:hypothetical protein
MRTASSSQPYSILPKIHGILLTCIVVLAIAFTSGCGSTTVSSVPPATPASTAVTVLVSSTVNDQFPRLGVSFNSITLTNKAGKTVNLFTSSQQNGQAIEFTHVNGNAEPLAAVSIPQDVYTSATVNFGPLSSIFSCVAANPDVPYGYEIYVNPPLSQVAVNVPNPITVAGTAMGLSLNMHLSPTTGTSACDGSVPLNATLSLAPTALSFEPTSSANGLETNLDGQVSILNTAGNDFVLTLADGQTFPFKTNGSTLYQGVSGLSALTAGTFIDMDAAIQSDGSQLATRIAVEDANSTNITAASGPVLSSFANAPVVYAFGRQQQGYLLNPTQIGFFMPYDVSNAVFQISRQFSNLQTLPFPARFDTTSIFGGQNVYITTHALNLGPNPTYFPASTLTLMPQTINGTVTGISTSGSFKIYSVELAPYDLIPTLSTQSGMSYSLNNPNTVLVYVDGSTKLFNQAQSLAVGGLLRFNGLLFDDDGTLRMDCGQVIDGVAE